MTSSVRFALSMAWFTVAAGCAVEPHLEGAAQAEAEAWSCWARDPAATSPDWYYVVERSIDGCDLSVVDGASSPSHLAPCESIEIGPRSARERGGSGALFEILQTATFTYRDDSPACEVVEHVCETDEVTDVACAIPSWQAVSDPRPSPPSLYQIECRMDSAAQIHSGEGVTVWIDPSCSIGYFDFVAEMCAPKHDTWGYDRIQEDTVAVIEKIFAPPAENCMGERIYTAIQSALHAQAARGDPFTIVCADQSEAPDACAGAALRSDWMVLYPGAFRCPPTEARIRHEMQHALAGDDHTTDGTPDPVHACDLACYGDSNAMGVVSEADCR